MDEGLYSIAPGETPQAVSSRRKIAEALIQQGTQTTPIQHWTQGIARLAQALSGTYDLAQADKQDTAGLDKAMKAYSAGMYGDAPTAPKPPTPDAIPRPSGLIPDASGAAPSSPVAAALTGPAKVVNDRWGPVNEALVNGTFDPQGRNSMNPNYGPSAPVRSGEGPSAPPQQQPQPAAPAGQPAQPPGQRPDPRLVAALANPYLPKPMQELAIHKAKEQMKPPEYKHFTAGDKNFVYDPSKPEDVRNLGPTGENRFQNVAELRKEIHTLPSYKNWTQAEPIYRSMLETQGTDSKASDLNLVYGLGKIMDPTSVVREGEMVMVSKTASLPDWLIGSINGLNGGARLTPETRKAILAEAKVRAGQYYDAVQGDVAPYRGIAKRFNMHEDDIIPPIRPLSSAQAAAPGGAAPVPQAAAAPPARPPVRLNSPLEATPLPPKTHFQFRDPSKGGAWTDGWTR